MITTSSPAFTLSLASEGDRIEIYKLRHLIYAKELKQHSLNLSCELNDNLDLVNHYIVAKCKGKVIGFISITPPTAASFSVDKYFDRTSVPYHFDENLYEIRLLTVVESKRKSVIALALMFASFRWVQSRQGKYIISICRSDIINMYKKAGLRPLNKKAVSGDVTYELCIADVAYLNEVVKQNISRHELLQQKLDWQLPFAFFAPSACYHGGSFFKAIGEDLQRLENAEKVINADVLDAWFPPSPQVLQTVKQHLPWLLQTSPPTHADGLIKVIADSRGVKQFCILHGAGSSDLIFLAFRTFLNKNSKVLIMDPCYGEYVHVLKNIIQCHIKLFHLCRKNEFTVDTSSLLSEIKQGYDFVILVNPNSPTGQYISKGKMEKLLRMIPSTTIVWIDETYIEYAGSSESLEQFACTRENVIVCKSMSKVYALSGVRVAYLCSSPHLIETLKALTPPWAVSLPAQAAAISALKEKYYYQEKYAETKRLRNNLKGKLHSIGIPEVIEGVANFLLFYLPEEFSAQQFLSLCQNENLFLRDVSSMGKSLGKNAIRIAVKDEETNSKMIEIIKNVLKILRT